MRHLILAAALACATTATAQDSITVEATDGFRFIRCVGMFGNASCEYLSASNEPYLRCVAFDADGEPLGVTISVVDAGSADFIDLSPDEIETVICE